MDSESPQRPDDRSESPEIGEVQQGLIAAARELEATDPDDLDAVVRGWKRAILAGREHRLPRRELARVLRAAARWDNLVAALKQEELVACPSPGERAEVLLEMAAIYRDHLGHAAMYVHSLTRVLELEPDNRTALAELADYYQASQSWNELAHILTRQARTAGEVELRVALLQRVAVLWEERCGNPAAAVAALEEARELAPDNLELASELRRAYEAAGQWDKLFELRRQAASFVADPQARLAEALELARLIAEKGERGEVSIAAWCDVLALDPGNREALTELAVRYRRHERWPELAETLDAHLEGATTMKERIRLLRQLADLYADKLGQPERAIGVLTELLTLAPDHRQAWHSLTELYLARGSWDEVESIYAAHGKLGELVRLLERQIDGADDEVAVELWRRIGRLYGDQLNKPRRAVQAFEQLLSLVDDDPGAVEALGALYQAIGEPDKLATLWSREYQAVSDPAVRSELARQLAALSEAELRDSRAALRWWLVAFEIERSSPEVRTEVERLARQTGDWEAMAAAYRRVCDALAAEDPLDSDTLVTLLLTRGRVEEVELRDVDRALHSYSQVLTVDESHTEAINAIGRIYWNAGRYQDLLAVFHKKLEQVSAPRERRQLLFTIARIGEEKLGDDRLAVQSCTTILDECGADTETLAMLDRIHERQGAWEALAGVLEQERALAAPDAGAGDDPDRTENWLSISCRLARLRRERLDQDDRAIADYCEVLAVDRSNREARAALEGYLEPEHAPERRLAAARALRSLCAEEGDAGKLATVYQVLIEAAPDSEERLQLLCALADLLEQRLDDPEAAFDALGRALAEDPSSSPVLARLEAMAESGERWSELAEILRRALSQPLPLSLQVELRCRLGGLYMDRMDERERAIRTFSRVLDLSSGEAVALAALEQLYAVAGEWHRVADFLRRRRAALTDPGATAEVDFRLAQLYERELGEVDAALDLYWQVLEQMPSHRPSLDAIERLLGEGAIVDTVARRQAFQRLAEVAEDGCGDPDAALAWWCEALFEDPSHAPAFAAIERLAGECRGWQQAAEAYQQALAGCSTAGARCRLLSSLIRINRQELARPERAEALCIELLALDPHASVARDTLAEIALDTERFRVLLDRAAEGPPDERLGLELGELAGRMTPDPEVAIAAYQMALQAVPRSRPALLALERLYRDLDRPEPYVELLERVLAVADDEAERIEICRKLVAAWESLGDHDRAVEYCEEILLSDDRDLDAYRRLEGYYHADQRWQPLLDTYQRHLFAEESSRAVTDLLCRIATVQSEQLGARQRAADTYDQILTRNPAELPDDPVLLGHLFERCEATRQLDPALALATRLAALEPEPARRGRWLHQAGVLCRDHRGDPDAALQQFESALDCYLAGVDVPDGGAVLRELQAIDNLLTAQEDWKELEAVYLDVAQRMSGADNAMVASMLWQNLAEIYSTRLGDREAAKRAFERGNRLAIGSDDP